MSKITTKERKKLPSSDFGLPGSKRYPMPDKAARASQQVSKGNLSESSKSKIDAKANKIIKGKK